METLNREDILRMIGLRDSAGLYSKINSLMIDMYDEGGKLAEYSTQIIQTEKNITLLAQRVTDDETDIADLTVTAQQISATVEHQQDEIDEVTGTVNGHTTQIGQLQVTAQQISASVSSLTDTVETQGDDISGLKTTTQTHTSQISSLQMTDTQIQSSVSSLRTDVNTNTGNITRQSKQISTISQKADSIDARVQVVEGDYVKKAQISLMVTKNEQGYISNALISADKIKFSTFDWTVTNPDTDKTVFHLDSDGNLTIAGTISAINSGNIVMTNDVNFYVNGGKFAKFGSTVSNFEAMLYVRNDGGQCIAAQSFNGGVGLFALGNSGSKAIQAVGPSEFALREGETLKITSMSTSSSFVNTYFAPYSAMRTSSFTLPSAPAEGTMFFCKGKSADLKVTTVSHPILNGDSSDVLVETNTTYNFGRNSIFLFFMGSYWGLIYSA